jgi:FolB domain-containing protein
MKHQPADQIHIEQLEVWTRIGVSEAEREKAQRLAVNLTLWLFPHVDDLNDDINKTADYSSVCEETKNFVETQQHRLIETLADSIAMFLLKRFPVHKVDVEVRKFVLPNAEYASVIVSRMAALD